MTSKEFFYLVAQMRATQRDYFALRDPRVLGAARRLEKQVDAEIERVRRIVNATDDAPTSE